MAFNLSVDPGVKDEIASRGLGSIQRLERLFSLAVPDDYARLDLCLMYDEEQSAIELQVNEPQGVALYFQFGRTESGSNFLNANVYHLPDKFQQQGIAKRFVVAMFQYCCEHGFQHVETHANERLGAYAWARYGAQPRDVGAVKAELLRRAQKYATAGVWSGKDRAILALLLNNWVSVEMMLRISQFSFESKHLGKDLLVGCVDEKALGWDAIWMLSDNRHRKVIMQALGL